MPRPLRRRGEVAQRQVLLALRADEGEPHRVMIDPRLDDGQGSDRKERQAGLMTMAAAAW